MFKKALISLVAVSLFSTASAFEEIECSTNTVFTENSCNQCFTGLERGQGANIGLLTDKWLNLGPSDKILYIEEQVEPEMINLDTENVRWIQTPSSNDFWEYSDEFMDIFSEDEDGYVLKSGEEVTWIKSKLSSAYKLEKNNVEKGGNIGLLVFPISTHDILDNGEIDIEADEHNECVLFTSGEAEKEVITVAEVKKLPQTGPGEYLLLLLFSIILGFGILQLKRRAQ